MTDLGNINLGYGLFNRCKNYHTIRKAWIQGDKGSNGVPVSNSEVQAALDEIHELLGDLFGPISDSALKRWGLDV